MTTDLLTIKDAARTLGIPYQSLHYRYLRGDFSARRFGHYLLVDMTDVQRALASRPLRTSKSEKTA